MMCVSCVSAGDTNNSNSHDLSKSNLTNIYGYGSFDELNSDIQNLEPETFMICKKIIHTMKNTMHAMKTVF